VQWKQVVTGLALLAILCAACSATTPAAPAATRATAKPAASVTNEPTPGAAAGRSACTPTGSVPAISPMRRSAASWPERSLLRQSPAEPVSDQVISPTTDTAYALTSRTRAPTQRPYILECTGLRTGGVHTGPRFSVGSLALVSGYLWIYGTPEPGSLPVISQVSQATLTRIRSVPLPPRPAGPGGPAFAAGPDDSVWIGYAQTLLRVDAATGAVVTRVTLPPGLGVSNISADPARTTLYVSAARAVRGGFEGLVMLEYDARSGAAAGGGLQRGPALLGGRGVADRGARRRLGFVPDRDARPHRSSAPNGPADDRPAWPGYRPESRQRPFPLAHVRGNGLRRWCSMAGQPAGHRGLPRSAERHGPRQRTNRPGPPADLLAAGHRSGEARDLRQHPVGTCPNQPSSPVLALAPGRS